MSAVRQGARRLQVRVVHPTYHERTYGCLRRCASSPRRTRASRGRWSLTFVSLVGARPGSASWNINSVPLFFRAIESEDGGWRCHRGRESIDRHANMDEALDHLRELAHVVAPAWLYAHFIDGRVERIEVVED